jgi:hypothetical protein
MSVTASPMNRKNGKALTLIAEGFLVDAVANLRYNTHINNAIRNAMFAFGARQFVSNVQLKDVREGSVVIVRGNFGSGPEERVTVEGVDSDIKNGMPGIDYDGHWAYLSQVVRVVKY